MPNGKDKIKKPSTSIVSQLGSEVGDAASEITKGSTFSRFSNAVKDFYKPLTDAISPKPAKKPVTNLKSNVPGDLEVTYDKEGYAINPNPFYTNKEGNIETKPGFFTNNSTVLPEIEILSSKKPLSKYEALRESMPKPTGKQPVAQQKVDGKAKERKDLKANKQQVDKMNNDKDVITNYRDEGDDGNYFTDLENKF